MNKENKKSEFMTNMSKIIDDTCETFNKDMFSKTQEELEEYWHFDFEKLKNQKFIGDYDYYKFFQALEHYRYFCRKWENHHNGYTCIVERVRDKYLLPKIRQFKNCIKNKNE